MSLTLTGVDDHMTDDEIKLTFWIAETRKKFADFITPVTYLKTSLDHIERLSLENKHLRGALSGMVSDLKNAPSSVMYDRDSLRSWIQSILDCKP
jgi:hypothetical protein